MEGWGYREGERLSSLGTERRSLTRARATSHIERHRHLMLNVVSLVPHCKKDSKVESQESEGATLNELIEPRNCSSCLFFDCRKQKDLYLWMVKCPSGPSVKFLVNADIQYPKGPLESKTFP
ncbi:ribosome biogenesis protein BRX1 homolog 1-like [Musa acuminata AAA Group]|uniref:ribosome biogenesis protein BRX1 homolog 1-like n=1 Tax=Musa acuminata AAA Group TaxID=214697 RepID=UPI0031D84C6C